MTKSALLTGANGGIGIATTQALVEAGYQVAAGVRDPAAWNAAHGDRWGGDVVPVTLDVADPESVADAHLAVEDLFGLPDAIINNAGVASMGTVEEMDMDEARRVFEVNLFGPLDLTKRFLPDLRGRGHGTIVMVSSIAGRMSAAGQVSYSASKWALECVAECLWQEVAPLGIRVVLLEPGVTVTPIFGKHSVPAETHYGHVYERLAHLVMAGLSAGTGPEVVAAEVVAALDGPASTLRRTCSWGGQEISEGWPRLPDNDLQSLEDGRLESFTALMGKLGLGL